MNIVFEEQSFFSTEVIDYIVELAIDNVNQKKISQNKMKFVLKLVRKFFQNNNKLGIINVRKFNETILKLAVQDKELVSILPELYEINYLLVTKDRDFIVTRDNQEYVSCVKYCHTQLWKQNTLSEMYNNEFFNYTIPKEIKGLIISNNEVDKKDNETLIEDDIKKHLNKVIEQFLSKELLDVFKRQVKEIIEDSLELFEVCKDEENRSDAFNKIFEICEEYKKKFTFDNDGYEAFHRFTEIMISEEYEQDLRNLALEENEGYDLFEDYLLKVEACYNLYDVITGRYYGIMLEPQYNLYTLEDELDKSLIEEYNEMMKYLEFESGEKEKFENIHEKILKSYYEFDLKHIVMAMIELYELIFEGEDFENYIEYIINATYLVDVVNNEI